jgi:AraC family transcriptional regulator
MHRALKPQPSPIPRVIARDCGFARVMLLPACGFELRSTSAHRVIGFAFDPQAGHHAYATDRVSAYVTQPNSIATMPAGVDVHASSTAGGEYLRLELSAASCPTPGLRLARNVIVHDAIAPAHQLRRLLLSRCDDHLMLEAALLTLMTSAARSPSRAAQSTARWLTPQRERLIDELIEMELHGKLTVHGIATRLNLSPDFLTRAFKHARGTVLHTYIADRRLARARQLLQRGTHTIADVAQLTGFASQSHLTTTMKQRLGITPGALAPEIRQLRRARVAQAAGARS